MIAIIGVGKMGEALLSGLLRAGHEPEDVAAVEKVTTRSADIAATYGVRELTLAEAAEGADTLVIAVKPQDMEETLSALDGLTDQQLVISIAAGITTAFIERCLAPARVPVVRVMPNTPAVVNEAMSVISAGSHAGSGHLDRAGELLSVAGKVLRIPESQQDAATALSGSGPAYVYYLAESMIDAGVFVGMPRPAARELVIQAIYGAATMLRDSGEHPVVLRENVSSPAGTTVAAIGQLESHGVRAAFQAAIEAARDRGRELGGG
ncbi:MAG: pyrroline-5-carboxylate reductase [Streptosporangiales bacterium]|jgi:pyrroline-5-carboxylate reductase|nr:pyrroline-5-carboxylate reductase [Streptosporangiales bacterium]